MAISESFLAMTIFRNEFDAKFAFIFAGLIICKAFHWVTRDRVDYVQHNISKLLRDEFIFRWSRRFGYRINFM